MRRKIFVVISTLLFSLCCLSLSRAALIVDTGPGPSSGEWPWALSSIHRGMAGKFTTSKTRKIFSVEAWMQVNVGGATNAIIYNDDGDGTVPGTKRFSQAVSLPANPVAGWRGATGLNWSLPAGTYWVGFEVDTPGIDCAVYYPVPTPLVAYAADIFEQPWFSVSGLEMGFRIQADIAAPLGGSEMLLLD